VQRARPVLRAIGRRLQAEHGQRLRRQRRVLRRLVRRSRQVLQSVGVVRDRRLSERGRLLPRLRGRRADVHHRRPLLRAAHRELRGESGAGLHGRQRVLLGHLRRQRQMLPGGLAQQLQPLRDRGGLLSVVRGGRAGLRRQQALLCGRGWGVLAGSGAGVLFGGLRGGCLPLSGAGESADGAPAGVPAAGTKKSGRPAPERTAFARGWCVVNVPASGTPAWAPDRCLSSGAHSQTASRGAPAGTRGAPVSRVCRKQRYWCLGASVWKTTSWPSSIPSSAC